MKFIRKKEKAFSNIRKKYKILKHGLEWLYNFVTYLKLVSPNFLQLQSLIFVLYPKSDKRNGYPLIRQDTKYNFVLGNIKFNALKSKSKWGSKLLLVHGLWQ